jgi:hypothetical protein
MESLFLNRELDERSQRRCANALDRWSAGIPFSPIKKLGSGTEFESGVELAAYHTTVTTQIEERRFANHEVPYRGQPLPSQARSTSDYDLWKLDFRRYADMAPHNESMDLPETRIKLTCPQCNGFGKVDCPTCQANGWLTCTQCSDSGRRGWLRHSRCGGKGQVERTKKVARTVKCGCRNRANCGRCKGKGTVVVEEKETFFEACKDCRGTGYLRCGGCPDREGEVLCHTCHGARQVTCPRCDGAKQVMKYATAEKSEGPKQSSNQYVPPGLPRFTKKAGPLSSLHGPVVFTQDEHRRIASFAFSEEPAAAVLSAEVERCRIGHDGHVLRQQIEITRCSLVEYRYRHAGALRSIHLNPAHDLVEDIAGPIQAATGDFERLAAEARGARRYEDAYRLVVRALCMDEARPSEQSLRNAVLSRLSMAYKLWALAAWLPAAAGWCAFAAVQWGTEVWPGALASLLPMMLGLHLLARDVGLRFGGRRARVTAAALTGLGALLSAASIHRASLRWPARWTDYLAFGVVTLALTAAAIWRSEERARRVRIEDHVREFPVAAALEFYVVGLDPETRWERRAVGSLAGATLMLLVAAGIAIYLGRSPSETVAIGPVVP